MGQFNFHIPDALLALFREQAQARGHAMRRILLDAVSVYVHTGVHVTPTTNTGLPPPVPTKTIKRGRATIRTPVVWPAPRLRPLVGIPKEHSARKAKKA